jgi:hypothetical protein
MVVKQAHLVVAGAVAAVAGSCHSEDIVVDIEDQADDNLPQTTGGSEMDKYLSEVWTAGTMMAVDSTDGQCMDGLLRQGKLARRKHEDGRLEGLI